VRALSKAEYDTFIYLSPRESNFIALQFREQLLLFHYIPSRFVIFLLVSILTISPLFMLQSVGYSTPKREGISSSALRDDAQCTFILVNVCRLADSTLLLYQTHGDSRVSSHSWWQEDPIYIPPLLLLSKIRDATWLSNNPRSRGTRDKPLRNNYSSHDKIKLASRELSLDLEMF